MTGKAGKKKKADVGAVLDDLCSRFLLNMPEAEKGDLIRICFQVEQAWWFYADLYCEQHWPKYHHLQSKVDKIYDDWIQYKIRVPVCGAILLNSKCDQVLLVRGWGARGSWGFPKGKINKGEDPHDCAIREVYEETSYNFRDVSSGDSLESNRGEQKCRLYVAIGVPQDFHFAPRTRKEISKITWHKLTELPTNKSDSKGFYLVAPYVGKLKKYLASAKGKEMKRKAKERAKKAAQQHSAGAGDTAPTGIAAVAARPLPPLQAIEPQPLSLADVEGHLGPRPSARREPFLSFALDASAVLAAFAQALPAA